MLRRERKRRLEAADAYREGGSAERADAEQREAELIEGYLPAELSDEELGELVDDGDRRIRRRPVPRTWARPWASSMGKVAGRADGKRVSAMVKERLAA